MKFWKFGLPAALACLACCAPLIAPLFAGWALAGIGLTGYFESVELAMAVLGLGWIGYWFYRRKQTVGKSLRLCSRFRLQRGRCLRYTSRMN